MLIDTRSMLHHAPRWLLGATLLAAATAAFAPGRAEAGEPAIPPGAQLTSWHDNGHGGRYLLWLRQGRVLRPDERFSGVVRSDTDCDPDDQGLNHCHNAIDLANGRHIVVINTHEMSRNRCLGAGDRLSLTAIGPRWLVGTLDAK
jgi:hypothetical protein